MSKFLIIIINMLILTACGDQGLKVKSDPSDNHVKEYTKALEDCKENNHKAEKLEEEKAKTKEKKENIIVSNPFQLKQDDIFLGNKNASVVVFEYFSPTCPHCVYFHNTILPQIKKKYIDTNKILYVSREFIGNKQDLDATILAKCDTDIETYYKFINVFLRQQSNWAYNKNYREILTNMGALGGTSAEKYAKCLNDKEKVDSLIENTRLMARQKHFIGTPSFIINGKLHLKSYSVNDLSDAIDKLLKEDEK